MEIPIITNNKASKAIVHVDLDSTAHIYKAHGWDYFKDNDDLFMSGMTGLLNFLDNTEIKATLFTVASNVNDHDKVSLLKEAANKGHEIASHSLTHPNLKDLSLAEKRKEIFKSKELLEDTFNIPVKGFRAPHYSIDKSSLKLLNESGYEYDTSIFPTKEFAKQLELSIVKRIPYKPYGNNSIIEIPLPAYSPLPFPFHPSYSLLFGNWYFNMGFHRFSKTQNPFIMLFHLTDFANPLPKDVLNGISSKLYTLSHLSANFKINKCKQMVCKVKERYSFTNTKTLIGDCKKDEY